MVGCETSKYDRIDKGARGERADGKFYRNSIVKRRDERELRGSWW